LRGNDEAARAQLGALAALFENEKAPMQWMLLHAYGILAEAALDPWLRNPDRDDDRARVRDAARRLAAFARRFACGRSRSEWIRARLAYGEGRMRRAFKRYRRALDLACAGNLLYEQWPCSRELAELAGSAAERTLHEARARAIAGSFAPHAMDAPSSLPGLRRAMREQTPTP
jgi:hypothetical protein